MKIQLLYFPGCPNVDAARAALREALVSKNLDLVIEEIDVEDPRAPTWARGWGSPTILIDGKEIYDQKPSGAPACRVYLGGAPSVDVIRARIASARPSDGKRVALPMVGAVTAAIALAVGFWLAYRREADDCGCEVPRRRRA